MVIEDSVKKDFSQKKLLDGELQFENSNQVVPQTLDASPYGINKGKEATIHTHSSGKGNALYKTMEPF